MIAALVPAAGQSARMGRPKLIMPVAGIPLIARVIAAFHEGGVDRVIVVAPPLDVDGAQPLIEAAIGQNAEVVIASSPTADMRASVELGIDYLSRGPEPAAILLAPADSPRLSETAVGQVIQYTRKSPGAIVVPCYEGRRGHPILLPWDVAIQIRDLPVGVGVNALMILKSDRVETLECDDPGILTDLDTPEDYLAILEMAR